MPNIFSSTDIMIPKKDFDKWSIIACDQFTSNIEYWNELERYVGNHNSFLSCIFPEAYLLNNKDRNIDSLHKQMETYLNNKEDNFNEYKNVYVYVERFINGEIRKGIVGVVDLEEYDYRINKRIRPSEETVEERVPVRAEVREGASLDMSHVILFIDDEKKEIVEGVNKDELEKIYDFDLNMDGGHIEGYLIQNDEKDKLDNLICEYEKRKGNLCYAVGDGNHSLAAAKSIYERYKENNEDYLNSPLRYALVEIENIYDPIQVFKPIHRVIDCEDYKQLLNALSKGIGEEVVEWRLSNDSGTFKTSSIKELQKVLDEYLIEHGGSIDYVHEIEDLDKLVESGSLGLYLPPINNDAFFEVIERDGSYARKSFSIGSAREKRYYLETRSLR